MTSEDRTAAQDHAETIRRYFNRSRSSSMPAPYTALALLVEESNKLRTRRMATSMSESQRQASSAATTEPRTIGCMRARRVTVRLRRKRGLTAEYVTDIVVPATWKRGTLLRYVRHSHPDETVKIVEWRETGGWTATAWLPNPAAFRDYRSGALV